MNNKSCNECGNRLGLKKTSEGIILCRMCYDSIYIREVEPEIECGEANQITDHIFLGSEISASDFNFISKNNITKILVIAKHMELYFESNPRLTYKQIPVNDEKTENISKYFDDCFQFIESRTNDFGDAEGNLLVHCAAGMSRSASIVIAYIMKKHSMKFNDAFNFVKQKRSIINPNPGFIKQLKKYEEYLNHEQNAWHHDGDTTNTKQTTTNQQ